jgi:hypothetical protein
MELKPFYHEASIALSEDFMLKMVVDIGVVDRIERLFESNMDDIILEMLSSVTVMTKVLWGVTRPNHEELTLGQVAGILRPSDPEKKALAEAVVMALGDLIRRAFLVQAVEPEPKKAPRKRKAA